ncbi:MAG: hypothetical protein L0H36_00765 [bacterium]|nr:hypothetical protein [bacterium]MDN5835148.1 hypothetical protein [bacterium]
MDERPFRSRPASRPTRSTEQPAPPEPAKPAKASLPETRKQTIEPSQQKPTTGKQPKSDKKPNKKSIWWIGVIVIVLFMAFVIWLLMGMRTGSSNSLIDTSKYQAVFSTNGQVYFGSLKDTTSDYMKLSNAYYLQSQTATGNDDSIAQNDSKLIKLGNEIYGPEDVMMVSKQQILYFENLKPDSKVSKLIDQYEASH